MDFYIFGIPSLAVWSPAKWQEMINNLTLIISYVSTLATYTYSSLSTERRNIDIERKGVVPTERLEATGVP